MSAEIAVLAARLAALHGALGFATPGPVLQALAAEALAIARDSPPGSFVEGDWAVEHDGALTSIVGPDVVLFAVFEQAAPVSVRVMAGTRILHADVGDPSSGAAGRLGVAGIDVGALGFQDVAAATAAPDESAGKYVGSMRITLIDDTTVVVNDVVDELGVARPVGEIVVDDATNRLQRAAERVAEAAREPGETASDTVGLPGGVDGGTAGTVPGAGGLGGGIAAAASVTAIAATAAMRRLLASAARRRDEPGPGSIPQPPTAPPATTIERPELESVPAPTRTGSVAPTSAPPVMCVFCGSDVGPGDRFCRQCGRPGAEARGEVWAPTHVVPAGGLYAFERPDPTLTPFVTLSAGLGLQVRRTAGAWSEVVASNGWTGWVDGRFLDQARDS